MATVEEVKPKSRLSQADLLALRTMNAEDKKLLDRVEKAFRAYDEKLEKWRSNPVGNQPALPDILKFAPYLKKLEGGVNINLWPGYTVHNRITGEPDTVASEFLDIRQSGHIPRSFEEAQRLLVLARMPNHKCGIVTWDQKETAPEVKKAEAETRKYQEQLAAKDDELVAAKEEIERLRKGVK